MLAYILSIRSSGNRSSMNSPKALADATLFTHCDHRYIDTADTSALKMKKAVSSQETIFLAQLKIFGSILPFSVKDSLSKRL